MVAWLVAGIVCGVVYGLDPALPFAAHVVLKASGVALLAAYAWRAAAPADRPIATVLALGALGDALIEVNLTAGALAFLFGHIRACRFYADGPLWPALRQPPVIAAALGVSLAAYALSRHAEVVLYAAWLGAMVALSERSRFAWLVPLGAMLFAVSDLLIFARMDILAASPWPGRLIWPLYFAGQVMIARGVVQTSTTAPSPSRDNGAWASATDSGKAA